LNKDLIEARKSYQQHVREQLGDETSTQSSHVPEVNPVPDVMHRVKSYLRESAFERLSRERNAFS
jgi:hypothetical protein